ncbi:MAG: hypothetical protein V1850_06355 [Candidatus Bathyarchaeota archaeon]
MKTQFIVYDDCEDMVLYVGENKEEAVLAVENHITDGYSDLGNVHMYVVAKELTFKVNRVTVEEDA